MKMDDLFNLLEAKLCQLLDLNRVLREDNQRLRQQMAVVNDQNKQLKDRVAQASVRLETLLAQFPEGE
jgi:cell division protein ZapB